MGYRDCGGVLFLLLFFSVFICGCGQNEAVQTDSAGIIRSAEILLTGSGIEHAGVWAWKDIVQLPGARFEHVYSVINNWPVEKKMVAKGIKIRALLHAAGIKAEAKSITIKGEDGYEYAFTCEQMLGEKRYYFPGIMDRDPAGAEPVEPIIAYEYMENTDQLDKAREDNLCFIMPQANVNEQTYHTFVKGVKEIIISTDDPGKWDNAAVYPEPGTFTLGDKVKLQHNEIGKVKMYYTLDGSNPTERDTLYNPSTYQPELNQPLVVEKDTIIKILTKGFGKYDSDIAEFHYKVKN